MTNKTHLEVTKEAYLEMMNNLLKERQDITKMYYEVKSKVDEIDKLLLAGDTGKVSNGQAAEIMAYANLFNQRHREPQTKVNPIEVKPKDKLTINVPINQVTNEEIDALRALTKSSGVSGEKLLQVADSLKDLPKPKQSTREDLITSSVADVKEDKHILPVEPEKKPRKGNLKGTRNGAVGKKGQEAILNILKGYGLPIEVKKLHQLVCEELGEDILLKSFQTNLSKLKSKNENVQSAGRGWYIYKH